MHILTFSAVNLQIIINPDVANTGGILELKEIASMAEAYQVAVSPHNYNSTTIALASTLHAGITMPNFLITEYFVPFEEIGLTISDNPLIPVEGYITLDNKPGLGMNLIEENFDKFPYKEFPRVCLLYTSPSPRDRTRSRMPSSA